MTGSTYDPLKRSLDVVIAAIVLLLTAPVQAVVAALVRRDLGSPVLFRQPRPGRGGEVFELVKFRTMRPDVAQEGPAGDAGRLTRLGSRLRATSLDELPSLWNVLKGDMSIVGPRPLLVAYLDRYTPEQMRRHEVRPGITGLAQVSGRNLLGWEQKFALDVEYVDKRSLRLDVVIVWKTVARVLARHGITDETGVSATEFLGSGEGTR